MKFENTEINHEVIEFIKFLENYIPVSQTKAEKYSQVPTLVIPEFTLEQWEFLKETGDWRALKAYLDEQIHSPAGR